MTERCQRASDMDLAAFLAEPQSPEWAEFRQHYLQCRTCATEVFGWTRLAAVLRSISMNPGATHPAEEQLAHFQRRPERLSVEERHAIEQHLKNCPACAEELSFVESFDFSLLEEDQAGARKAKEPSIRAAVSTYWESLLAPFFAGFRHLVLHPAFAYAVALLLAIPAVRYYALPAAPESTRSLSGSAQERAGVTPGKPFSPSLPPGISASGEPHVVAHTLLNEYKAAYEARDVEALRRIWQMSPEVERELGRLFAETKTLTLLFDEREVRASAQGDRVSVEFLQGLMRVTADNRLYAVSAVYTADLQQRADSKSWVIQDLQKLPD